MSHSPLIHPQLICKSAPSTEQLGCSQSLVNSADEMAPLAHSIAAATLAACLQGTLLLPAVTSQNSAEHMGCYMYKDRDRQRIYELSGASFQKFLVQKEGTGFYWDNLTPFSLELKL